LYIDLAAPEGRPLRMGHGDGTGRLQAGSSEVPGVDRRERAIGAVGPHDGVQVHDTTALELGHPAEGEPNRTTCIRLRTTEHGGELALGVDHRAPPQLRGAGVLEHGAHVVVAIGAEGSPDQLVSALVSITAALRSAVGAASPRIAGVTRGHGRGRVDGTETRDGQSQEHGRVQGNRLTDALAALKSGPDEVAGISPVHRCARGAADFGAGAARLEDDAVGERCAGERHGLLPGGTGDDETTEPDRMAAPAAAVALGQEVLELTAAPVTDQGFEHGVVVGMHGIHGGAPV